MATRQFYGYMGQAQSLKLLSLDLCNRGHVKNRHNDESTGSDSTVAWMSLASGEVMQELLIQVLG